MTLHLVVFVFFMELTMHVFGEYTFRIVISSWHIVSLQSIWWSFLFLLSSFGLRCSMSNTRIARLAFFLVPFAWNTFSHPFIFYSSCTSWKFHCLWHSLLYFICFQCGIILFLCFLIWKTVLFIVSRSSSMLCSFLFLVLIGLYWVTQFLHFVFQFEHCVFCMMCLMISIFTGLFNLGYWVFYFQHHFNLAFFSNSIRFYFHILYWGLPFIQLFDFILLEHIHLFFDFSQTEFYIIF